jgi:hypothetical protein
MSFLSGRSTISADILARQLADYIQIKNDNQEATVPVFEMLRILNKSRQYSFSLYNSNDAALLS